MKTTSPHIHPSATTTRQVKWVTSPALTYFVWPNYPSQNLKVQNSFWLQNTHFVILNKLLCKKREIPFIFQSTTKTRGQFMRHLFPKIPLGVQGCFGLLTNCRRATERSLAIMNAFLGWCDAVRIKKRDESLRVNPVFTERPEIPVLTLG